MLICLGLLSDVLYASSVFGGGRFTRKILWSCGIGPYFGIVINPHITPSENTCETGVHILPIGNLLDSMGPPSMGPAQVPGMHRLVWVEAFLWSRAAVAARPRRTPKEEVALIPESTNQTMGP